MPEHMEKDVTLLFFKTFIEPEAITDWRAKDRDTMITHFTNSGYTVDFDERAHNWAAISSAGKAFAYLWATYPLIMIEDSVPGSDSLTNIVSYLSILTTRSIDLQELCFNLVLLKDRLNYKGDPDCFSVFELFTNTNSRN